MRDVVMIDYDVLFASKLISINIIFQTNESTQKFTIININSTNFRKSFYDVRFKETNRSRH